jgi:hypothetical protein
VQTVRRVDEQQLRERCLFNHRAYTDEFASLARGVASHTGSCDPEALAEGLLTDRYGAVAMNYAARDEHCCVVGSTRVSRVSSASPA